MQIKKSKKVEAAKNTKAVSARADSTKYSEAQKHIKAAIDILAANAKNDEVAKDNIANLSVVMFDLMGSEDK